MDSLPCLCDTFTWQRTLSGRKEKEVGARLFWKGPQTEEIHLNSHSVWCVFVSFFFGTSAPKTVQKMFKSCFKAFRTILEQALFCSQERLRPKLSWKRSRSSSNAAKRLCKWFKWDETPPFSGFVCFPNSWLRGLYCTVQHLRIVPTVWCCRMCQLLTQPALLREWQCPTWKDSSYRLEQFHWILWYLRP